MPAWYLSDAHAHLESYTPEALDETISRARTAGVGTIIASGITLLASSKTVEIAQRYDGMWAVVGIHPWHAERLGNGVAAIRELCSRERPCNRGRVVGLGEIGLDFAWHPQTRELQLPLFDRQLQIARELDLPVVIHTKGAHQETLDALKKNGIPENRGIIQGFTGDVATMEDWLQAGLYISIGVKILRQPSEPLAEMIRHIPSERLLLETDAAARRTLSEGLELTTLKPIAEKVAEIRNVPLGEIARITTANLERVFRLEDRAPMHRGGYGNLRTRALPGRYCDGPSP